MALLISGSIGDCHCSFPTVRPYSERSSELSSSTESYGRSEDTPGAFTEFALCMP